MKIEGLDHRDIELVLRVAKACVVLQKTGHNREARVLNVNDHYSASEVDELEDTVRKLEAAYATLDPATHELKVGQMWTCNRGGGRVRVTGLTTKIVWIKGLPTGLQHRKRIDVFRRDYSPVPP